MPSNRLNWSEEYAIRVALAELLAGEGPQGFDDEPDQAEHVMRSAQSAMDKLSARAARRGDE